MERENAESALPTTNGARDMFSTPPAITKSTSPLLMARAALASGTGDFFGQACEEQGHARDVAIIFAGLIGAAEEHVVERGPIDPGVARYQRGDRDGGEIVGADGGERAAVAADRRANRVADVGVGHGASVMGQCGSSLS
jgi:hypothetical protein